MKIALTLTRYIVGILFIFSGLVKANDPMGLAYKMQEFFEVWNWHFLNDYALFFSVMMIAFEIIAGVAVIIGWQFRLFSWMLLLLIIFFTFLTAYAAFSGKIKECGCFGDCFKLPSMGSFLKDIALTILIVFLFVYRDKISSAWSDKMATYGMIAAVIFSFAIQFWVLAHLPIVDCLPYKTGANILEKRKIPAGAIPDSTVITFVYKKDGKDVEFDADHFPADFSDSAYQFVNRYDKVVRKGNAEPPIKDFVLVNENNIDTTEAILNQPGQLLILFAKSWDPSWNEEVKAIQAKAVKNGIPFIIATSVADLVRANINAPVMKSDFVAIKTAARVDPTLYLLDGGTIVDKWALTDAENADDILKRKD
ncbi:MAG TPA: BT_3928 family protein [Chitinophagaceae bacterium]|nr:BT_3928 family protein [Chitinophagaceae bacterium]